MHVGNDVVDLGNEETAASAPHRRFAARVCSPSELRILTEASDPHRLLWAYWAAKESSFKALRKVAPRLRFIPRRFAVSFRPGNDGGIRHALVQADGLTTAVDIHEARECLHAVARVLPHKDGRELLFWQIASDVHRLPARPLPCTETLTPPSSAAGRSFLCRALANHLGCRLRDLHVERPQQRGAPPRIVLGGHLTRIDVSLSHHGRFVAHAFACPTLEDAWQGHDEAA